jgi:hypothetical protein
MLRRRRTDTFGLSFLDCICCGFGAVVLFYVMMSAQGGLTGLRRSDVLRSEVNRLQEQVRVGTRNLAVLRNTLESTRAEAARAEENDARLVEDVARSRLQLATYDADSLARRARIEQLQADIRSMEEGARRLEAGSDQRAPPGQETHTLSSDTAPRYITGLTLRGKRILVLLDRSASMLHEDLVSVIRLRNTDDATKRAAAKWRRAVAIVDWIATQMPRGSQYQIYDFNVRAEPLVTATPGVWLAGGDAQAVARSMQAVHELVPRDGTSLVNAFAVARTLSPLPDQIILITDGLPTQGKAVGTQRYIDAGARAGLFDEALRALPEKVPVDVVLLPMKGEVEAAHRFWYLARVTHGTLLAPSKDWP